MSDQPDYPNLQVLGLDPPWVEGSGSSSPTPSPQAGEDDLGSRTKADLLEEAQARGITPANNDMTKAELIAALEAND